MDDGADPHGAHRELGRTVVGEVARRDEVRIARRLYRKEVVDGVYRLDEGALLEDFWLCRKFSARVS